MVNFDIEMKDHDELADATVVRISTTEGNEDIATATLRWLDAGEGEDAQLVVDLAPDVTVGRHALQTAVRHAVMCELKAFGSETLRDLFANVTPSGSYAIN